MPYLTPPKEKTEKLESHDLEGTALSKLCAVLNSIPSIQVDICDMTDMNPTLPLCKALQLIQKQKEEHC